MRVEHQQNETTTIDVLQQIAGKEEKETGISFLEKAAEKCDAKASQGSVNLKDATYLKPGTEEKKTATEEIQENLAVDARERKNQMAVLSNTTSEEDYARMQEDGFSLDSTSGNTIVTVTDKIKAQLAKAGVDISCFGDDLDLDQLAEITGSPELAARLAAEFARQDVPLTGQNVKETVEAAQRAETVTALGEGAMKYLLDNHLPPTIENLYKAEYSGSSSYRPGQPMDISSFADQIEKVIGQAGLAVDEQTMADSKWMIENDIPLTAENLKYLEALKSAVFPTDESAVLSGIATAIAEGKRPGEGMLLPGYDLLSQAQHAVDVVAEATDEDVRYVVENELEMNIRNLETAKMNRSADQHEAENTALQKGRAESTATASVLGPTGAGQNAHTAAEDAGTAGDTVNTHPAAEESAPANQLLDENAPPEYPAGNYTRQGLAELTARRQLEEIRLGMTVEANYALLKKGVAIDTEPLEKLIEQLRSMEDAYYRNLLKAQGMEPSEQDVSVFRDTSQKIAEMKFVPAFVLGMRGTEPTVNAVHQAGTALKERFERANLRYESLMIMPQEEMGDSYEKAFQNAGSILEEIGMEDTEVNRRAVRILGYNQLEITPEAVAKMKGADEDVQRVFKNMTPAVVTELIKKGINPLDMDFERLNQVVGELKKEIGDDDSKRFGEFLWKLERSDAINEDERSSYIGIYRLINQVEKTDGAAIGALVNQGADVTMRNLMMAVRTERKSKKVDYVVDDSFGERVTGENQKLSITSQIDIAYQKNCLRDAIENVTPEKLKAVMDQVSDWSSMAPEQFKAALKQTEAQTKPQEQKLDAQYAKEQLEQFRENTDVSRDIYQVLEKYDIPNTMANITAVDAMIKNRNAMFGRIFGKRGKNTEKQDAVTETKEGLNREGQQILDEFQEALKGPEEMQAAQEKLEKYAGQVIEESMESDTITSIDIRELRLLSTQLSITGRLSREEQYSVPVQAGEEIVNVSLKIVRGADRKGIVDIMMETGAGGKIAATFQAREHGINGLVAADRKETRQFLAENGKALAERIGADEPLSINYVHVKDLDLNHFSMGAFGVEAEESGGQAASEAGQVQTTRLYHIAESFIRTIRETL